MRQIIIDFGTVDVLGRTIPLRIYGYGLMLVLGFLTGVFLAQWRARRAGENPEFVTHCGILALIGGIVGARVAYVYQHWDRQFANAENRIGALLDVSSGGLIYYGGLVLATVLVVGYLYLRRLPVRRFLDIIAASLMVGLAFGRVGCLLNGCCYGQVCDPDWALGMRFPMFSKPLLAVRGGAGPFSYATDAPTPVYAVQFSNSQVTPDERLVRRDGNGRRLRLPRQLHGALDQDQLAVMFSTEKEIRRKFDELAGDDGLLSRAEWDRGIAREGGLLRGSECWKDALAYEPDLAGQLSPKDLKLSFRGLLGYFQARKQSLIGRFAAKGKSLKPHSPEWKKADEYLREDLFALAENEWSRKVQPAQALGIANALLIAVLVTAFYRRRRREGQVFALMVVMYPITRFVLESIRSDNKHNLLAGELTHNQKTSGALLLGGVLLFLLLRKLPAWCGGGAEKPAKAAAGGSRKDK